LQDVNTLSATTSAQKLDCWPQVTFDYWRDAKRKRSSGDEQNKKKKERKEEKKTGRKKKKNLTW